jgi:hypothetical protein
MSQVIINDIPPYTQATAILDQVVFGTNWTANYPSDVVVYVTPEGDSPDDFTQILSYPSQYSVIFVGALQQVQVTLVTPSAQGDIVTITRMTPSDRENLYNNSNFLPSMLNNDFGILTLVDQQAQLVNQSIAPRYNYSATITPIVDTIIPILPANSFWAMNENGTGIVALNIGEIVAGGTVTQINTGTGLTGGPITETGTISFAPIAANSLWVNNTGFVAVPVVVATSYFLISGNNLSDVPNKATARTNLGLAIGVNVEAWSAALDSIAGLTTSANEIPYLTGSNTYSVMTAAPNAVLVTNSSNVPSLSQTLPTAVQSNITQLGAQSQALNMNSHQINNVTNPTNAQDAATKNYVDSQSGAFLPITGGTMSGAINMGNNKIDNMADPTLAKDAVNLEYLNTQLAFYLPLAGGTMSGQINMNSNKIVGLATPTNGTDAANKAYVDSVATGFTVQPTVAAATTANLNATYLNGASGIGATLTNAGSLAALVIDGYTVQTNDRILVDHQTTTFQNGIYVATNVGSGAVAWILTRASDYDQPAQIQPGDLVVVNNGTTYAGTSFIETATVTAVGTDPILFSQFTFSASQVLLVANNLSDVASTTTSFNNISPLTTKGDLIGYSTQNVRLAVGTTNGMILQVNSGAATGLAWSTATYPTTTTANQILYSSSTNTVAGLSTLAGGVLVTDASSVPQFLTNPSAAGKVLQSGNAAIPTWSTPTYPSASGSSGLFLISNGTNNVYSTSTIPTSAGSTAGKILVSDGTNYVLSTPTFPNASASSGKIIISNGTNWIASTPTFPSAAGTSGNVLTSDGTNWISSPSEGTGTVSPGLINQLAWYSAAGTTVGGLTIVNSAVLTTTSGGVPTWVAYTGSGAPALATSPSITTGLNDANGNIWIAQGAAASAVNYIQVANSATGVATVIQTLGSDANIGLTLATKGNSNILLQNRGATVLATGTTTASDVNYVLVVSNATGSAPLLIANGSDTNIILQLQGKGTGGATVQGTGTNNSASAGYVGEVIKSVILASSPVSFSTTVVKDLTSISLTAGDWDLWGNFKSTGTSVTQCAGWINTTSASQPDNSQCMNLYSPSGNGGLGGPVPQITVSISSTTTYYISGVLVFTGSSSVCGSIYARRRR